MRPQGYVLTTLALSLALLLCSVPALGGETEETNKALARRFYEEVWFSQNLAVVDELVAPTYVVHDVGDRKGVRESAEEQKRIAEFFWQRGTMTGRIDYQIAEGDLVATRWQWEFHPRVWWGKALAGRTPLPIINVFRFQNGKIVEIWNHRHDIDSFPGNLRFIQGLAIGLAPSLVLLVVSVILRRKLRKTRAATATGAALV
ncbi:MAG: nuclear transport factor 2 family protein [Candidatus Acidiferrales bacterium]